MSDRRYNKFLNRRRILAAAAALPLSGCDFAPYGISLDQWGTALGTATGLQDAPDLKREQVEQIPFATISYRVGKSSTSILILAETSAGSSLWTSSQRLAVVTSKGRILQTAGFHWNLTSTNIIGADPVGTTSLLGARNQKLQRLCDFSDINKFQIPIITEFEVGDPQTISILGSDIKTIQVIEHCRCEALNWDFDNFYAIDRTTGFVWQTSQYVHPNEAQFVITVLRPEA
jgi:hypothetical protein